MAEVDCASLQVYYRSDIVVVDYHWEDRAPIEALAYYAIARDPKGNQWVHGYRFKTMEKVKSVGEYADGPSYYWEQIDVDTVEAKAALFARRITASIQAGNGFGLGLLGRN